MPPRNPHDWVSKHVALTESIALGSYEIMQNYPRCGFNGKVIVITGPPSAYVGRMVSKFRGPLDIICLTSDLRTALELNLVWGVRSCYDILIKDIKDTEMRNAAAIKHVFGMGLITIDDVVMIVSRSVFGKHTGALTAIYRVSEILKT